MLQIGPFANRVFLQFAIRHQQHRPHRRRHRDLIGAHRGLGEVLQRNRQIVPFRVVADHRRGILDAVGPFPISGVPHRGVQHVADDDVNRHAVTIGVVDRHGGVLQSDRAVGEYAQRLALNLGVAVAHGDRRLFMATGDELGILVASVVDHRFMESSETRTCNRANVFEAERLDDVDHEVRPGAIHGQHFDIRGRIGFDHRRHQRHGDGAAAVRPAAQAEPLPVQLALLLRRRHSSRSFDGQPLVFLISP